MRHRCMVDLFSIQGRYHYTQLNGAEKEIYNGIYNNFKRRCTKFEITMKPTNGRYPDNQRLEQILAAVLQDNPAMYYVDSGNVVIYRDPRRPERLVMTYKEFFTPAQSRQIEDALRYRVDAILNMLYDNADGYPRVFNLYRYLVENVQTCDSGQRETLEQLESHSIIGPLLNRRSVCAGMAKTFQLICELVGVGCIHVIGEARPSKDARNWSPHSWNAVYLEGRFYHADPTFDCAYTKSRKRLSCQYFLVSDDRMQADHRWKRDLLPPMVDSYL